MFLLPIDKILKNFPNDGPLNRYSITGTLVDESITTVGWREWVSLPELGIKKIKAKIDSGARTSCLHTFSLEPFEKNGKKWIRFGIHPFQRNTDKELFCEAEIFDERIVSDSGGHREKRYVIKTLLLLADKSWPIEITLTNRDTMRFRMLVGRTAMKDKIHINPESSYLCGKPAAKIKTGKKG